MKLQDYAKSQTKRRRHTIMLLRHARTMDTSMINMATALMHSRHTTIKKPSLICYKQIGRTQSTPDMRQACGSEKYTNTAIIVTRAKNGATLLKNGNTINIPTERPLNDSEIINPVGAGDMFSAEVAMKLFEGLSMEKSIQSAHVSTARILTSRSQQNL